MKTLAFMVLFFAMLYHVGVLDRGDNSVMRRTISLVSLPLLAFILGLLVA